MAKIIGLPKLSPTMEEGTLVRWAKKEGDPVEIDDLLAEVETDKATMEFRSFDKGVLLKQLAKEGATLVADAPVAILGTAGEDISKLVSESQAKPAQTAPQERVQAETQQGAAPPAVAAAPTASTTTATGADKNGGRVLASPLVRKIARDQEIDLRKISGTGPGGRVVKRDLDNLASKTPTSSVSGTGESRSIPLTSMRKTIARRLTESKQQVPHFYLTVDVDAEPAWFARLALNEQLEKTGEKVSVNDIVIKACATALRRVPEVNASFTPEALVIHDRVDISVAVAVPDGLVTPVVRQADALGILAIAREVRGLAGRAREKKLRPEEITNGTFSVSNLGMYGVDEFSAVINPPEGAILAVGAVREEPVVRDGQVVPGRRMKLTLSCDHRVIDGALGARFLKTLRELLEHPLSMLL